MRKQRGAPFANHGFGRRNLLQLDGSADPNGSLDIRFGAPEERDHDSGGDASFTFKTTKKVPKGQVVTATATNQSTGDTSEFSEAEDVT